MVILIIIIILSLVLFTLIASFYYLNKKSDTASAKKQTKSKRKDITKTISPEIEKKLKETFKGKYSNINSIKASGIGLTVHATDNKNSHKVIIKTINPDLQNEEEALDKFYKEIDAIKRLNHPNVARILEIVNNEAMHYYVTEFLEGQTLKSLLEKEGKLPEKKVVFILTQVLKAILHCHTNKIIHRDIQPANIFITQKETIKLINFGIVKILSSHYDVMKASTRTGTPLFGSPEQIQGLAITSNSDVYSLAVCAYYMLTNHFPFKNTFSALDPNNKPIDIKKHCPDLSPKITELIYTCLEHSPEKRLSSMDLWKELHFMNQ
ncbi:hypothetical protein BVX93_00245 [bacterium B13(2017)]|nr:hypothetical protein BVX93_00245 [bacterium B13(2017)]